MNLEELIDYIHKKMIDKPNYFLFRENEPIATDSDVRQVETLYKGKLPENFIKFQKEFGGGIFAFIELTSICPNSDYYVLNNSFPDGYFLINDDQTGGGYFFKNINGIFEDKIFYLDFSAPEIEEQDLGIDFIGIFNKLAFNK